MHTFQNEKDGKEKTVAHICDYVRADFPLLYLYTSEEDERDRI